MFPKVNEHDSDLFSERKEKEKRIFDAKTKQLPVLFVGMWHRTVSGVRPMGKMSHLGPSKWLILHSFKIFGDVTLDTPHSMCIINPTCHFS